MTDQPNEKRETVRARGDTGGEAASEVPEHLAEQLGSTEEALAAARRERGEEAGKRLATAGVLPTATAEPLTGAVADIEDRYTLIINKGKNAGVEPGMIFAVLGDEGNHVFDPITKEDLGARPGVKLRVKVTDVFEKFSRAETYVIVSPLQGFGPDISAGSAIKDMLEASGGLVGTLGGRQRVAGYGKQRPDEEPPPQAVVPVRIGDPVKQVG